MSIIDFVKDMVEKARQFVANAGLDPDKEFSPDDLDGRLEELRAAVERAIAKDKEDAHNLWVETGSALLQGIGYPKEKHKFEGKAEESVDEAMRLLAEIEGLVEKARAQAESAIAELESSAAEWQEHAQQIYGVKEGIDQVRFIEGWDGPAAQEYSRACVVQGNATWELAGVVQSAGAGFATLAIFNRALLQLMGNKILSKATSDIMRLEGGGLNEFYKRTNNTIAILEVALWKTSRAARGEPVAAAGAELEMQVYKTLGAPNLLTTPERWPSGTSMVDRVAGQTNQVEAPDGPVTRPDHTPKPEEEGGIKRW